MGCQQVPKVGACAMNGREHKGAKRAISATCFLPLSPTSAACMRCLSAIWAEFQLAPGLRGLGKLFNQFRQELSIAGSHQHPEGTAACVPLLMAQETP